MGVDESAGVPVGTSPHAVRRLLWRMREGVAMTKNVDIHFDSEYDVVARRIGNDGHVTLTVEGAGDFTMFFQSDNDARAFLAIALHELNRVKFPVEVES